MQRNMKWLLIILISGGIFMFLANPHERPPVEELAIQIISGFDIIPITEKDVQYEISRGFYVFGQGNKQSSKIAVGRGTSGGSTREDVQLKSDKPKINGQIKVTTLSDAFARYGIMSAIDIHFKDAEINDTSIYTVCKGNPKSIILYKVPGHASSADFIEGLVEGNRGSNFFSDEYTSKNIYLRLNSEGRNITLPYIEIKQDGIEITGMALFKKDKMVAVADIKNTRIMNMLRNNNVKGIVTLQNNNGYIDFNAKSTKKIKCYKEAGNYNFIINLKLKGDIITNTMSNNPLNSYRSEKFFEDLLAENIKKQCYEFIGKMKNEYKVDCLELGRVAAATYGRRKGIDWDEVTMDSNIQIKVEVKMDRKGRGNY